MSFCGVLLGYTRLPEIQLSSTTFKLMDSSLGLQSLTISLGGITSMLGQEFFSPRSLLYSLFKILILAFNQTLGNVFTIGNFCIIRLFLSRMSNHSMTTRVMQIISFALLYQGPLFLLPNIPQVSFSL